MQTFKHLCGHLREKGAFTRVAVLGAPTVQDEISREFPRLTIYDLDPNYSSQSNAIDANSLDFVYFGGPTTYEPVIQLMREWYPCVRAGGVLAGHSHLDGVIDGVKHGVRTALRELAREHCLHVRLTLDPIQTWFCDKPYPSSVDKRLRIAILTAYDGQQAGLAAVSAPNKSRYCETHGYDFIEETIGFQQDRPAVWAKIPLLRKHLPYYDWVFWSDVDSLIMNGGVRLEDRIDDECDFVIGHEDLGTGIYNINAGQMFFRNTKWSQWFLEMVWGQTQFLNDRLQEQRAIIHLLWSRDLGEHVHIVPQWSFNSYNTNYTQGDFLIHFPDIPNEQRLQLMQNYAQASTV